MTGFWAIDTGVSRNACALARGERTRGGMWRVDVWSWQGTTGNPLRIETVVAPAVSKMLLADGAEKIAADSWYLPELRRGLGDRITVRVQGGKLRDVYWPAHYLVHHAEPRLYVEPVGHVWTVDGWQPDPRAGERVVAGLNAVERRSVGGEQIVSLPEIGRSHHDEAVAVMRMLWDADAAAEADPARAATFGPTAYQAAARGTVWYPTPEY